MVSVVKLPSATIPCFFLLLFIRAKRQGLNLRKNRLIAGLIETKWIRLLHTKRYESYQLIRMVCVGIMVYQSSPPFFPLFPLQPLLPPIIPLTPPLKQINCLRPPCQNGETTATTRNDNQMFRKGSFPLQPSISKSYTVSQQSRPWERTGVRFKLVDSLRLFHMEN